MVRSLPTLSGAALVPRGCCRQPDESAVPALPQDRDGDARDLPDGGPFPPRVATEDVAAHRITGAASRLGWALSARAAGFLGESRSFQDGDDFLPVSTERR